MDENFKNDNTFKRYLKDFPEDEKSFNFRV